MGGNLRTDATLGIEERNDSAECCSTALLMRPAADPHSRSDGGEEMNRETSGTPNHHSCGSAERKVFPAEIFIHFTGLQDINNPLVTVFSNILVCTRCGAAEFTMREAERRLLMNRNANGSVNSPPQPNWPNP